MTDKYEEVIGRLRDAYDAAVDERSASEVPPWKQREWETFLQLLRREGRHSLLEIGSGTGVHARFFADSDLEVVCTDLSPAMVEHCRDRGLEAHQTDVLHLVLGRSFDAVFAFNCLLHVPFEDLPAAFGSIRSTLVPSGLFYLGQYGGIDQDGEFSEDTYEPKRFFSWLTDDRLRSVVSQHFEIESFTAVDIDSPDGSHFQSLVLRA